MSDTLPPLPEPRGLRRKAAATLSAYRSVPTELFSAAVGELLFARTDPYQWGARASPPPYGQYPLEWLHLGR